MPASVSLPTAATGLSSEEAHARLLRDGANEVPEPSRSPLLALLLKFWAPVPWMLELAVVLELVLHRRAEAIVIGALLVFNALLSYFYEGRAQTALALLKQRLSVQARVLRDGEWRLVPAREVVVGDTLHVRMGDIIPADLKASDGQVQVDQSALTGESLPVDAGPGTTLYSGAIVKRGECTGLVTATGARTYFGKTAELVGKAETVSHLQSVILAIVRYLIILDAVLVALLLGYALLRHVPMADMAPFALILLVASVPAALPATFTLATSLGSLELARHGVLVTRLSAIEEAAAMETLCVDKTGTITENRLRIAALKAYPPFTDDSLLAAAALASDRATQDPIDLAIFEAITAHHQTPERPENLRLTPFDPATKRAEAHFLDGQGHPAWVAKGAPAAVTDLVAGPASLATDVETLSAHGYRVLAVARGDAAGTALAGLVALEDPPRADSRSLVQGLHDLHVKVTMVTGDGLATARAISQWVGIGDRACAADGLRHLTSGSDLTACDVYGGVYPEDKFALVKALQAHHVVTGMTGDGVNDAPALKQAEVGIAVANATDVAKAAASLVLTTPGLTDLLSAVKESRRIHQRMLTYTLNKIMKTIEIAVFLSVGVMVTGQFIITPLLIVLLLFTNDFVTMSIASDQVGYSPRPDRWHIRTLMLTGIALAFLVLVLSFAVFFYGRDVLHLPLPALQTLVFFMLVLTGQGSVYLVRERDHFWRSRPGRWMLLASILDIVIVFGLASGGILMAPVAPGILAGLAVVVMIYLGLVDFAKIAVFRTLGLRGAT